MLSFNGSYQRPVDFKATIQTYRGDDGAHLVIVPEGGETIDIRMRDSECKALSHALRDVSEEAPF